jgi:hypothetical protein
MPPTAPARQLVLLSLEVQEAFIAKIANGTMHTAALRSLGLTWRRVSLHMTTDPEFATRYQEAITMREQLITILREEEADRRAIEGWDEPVFQNGIQVGVIRRFSDKLMELRLKATNPRKYAERYEHTGVDGGPIVQQVVGGPTRPASIAEWERQVREAWDRTLRAEENGEEQKMKGDPAGKPRFRD